jgi:hypothetical protein
VATSLHFSDWETFGPGLATSDGLGWGSSVGDLEKVYPDVHYWINDYAPMWLAETPGGRLMGGFDWSFEDFSWALQTALNEHGANLEVNGNWFDGPTETALFDFIEERGLEEEDMLSALGLPASDVRLGFMHTGTGPLCD